MTHLLATRQPGTVCGEVPKFKYQLTDDPSAATCEDCLSNAEAEAAPDTMTVSDPELIELLRAIRDQRDHPALKRNASGWPKIDGAVMEMQTANVIVSVYDLLNPDQRERLLSWPLPKMVDACWKLARRGRPGQ